MKIGVALILAGFSFVMALAGSTFVGTKIVAAHPTIGLGSFEDALQTGRRQIMSKSISTLLLRNLSDVFGEGNPVRRRAALEELWNEDGVFYDPNKGVYRGHDEIDRIAGALRATHPDFQYQPIAEPEELGNGGRIKWVSGIPGQAPAYGGTDFLIARDGRIAALYLFFDKLP